MFVLFHLFYFHLIRFLLFYMFHYVVIAPHITHNNNIKVFSLLFLSCVFGCFWMFSHKKMCFDVFGAKPDFPLFGNKKEGTAVFAFLKVFQTFCFCCCLLLFAHPCASSLLRVQHLFEIKSLVTRESSSDPQGLSDVRIVLSYHLLFHSTICVSLKKGAVRERE